MEPVVDTVCRIIETSARGRGLPVVFLTRLIWRESSFRPGVTSPAGAQGIAQFMPGTATERGLGDPFDPEEAIPQAARLLADLKVRFGNVGLAAAAYNAGPTRVANWLAGTGTLPGETRTYVSIVTLHAPEDWIGGDKAAALTDAAAFPTLTCGEATAALRRSNARDFAGARLLAPWGVQIAGGFSKAAALASYARARRSHAALLGGIEPMVLGGRLLSRGFRPFYRVRAPAASRAQAETLCKKILAAGGACAVLRS